MDAPGEFEVVLRAHDLVENGRSLQEVERTLHELRRWYPDAEVLPELEWKLVDLLAEELRVRSGPEVSQ